MFSLFLYQKNRKAPPKNNTKQPLCLCEKLAGDYENAFKRKRSFYYVLEICYCFTGYVWFAAKICSNKVFSRAWFRNPRWKNLVFWALTDPWAQKPLLSHPAKIHTFFDFEVWWGRVGLDKSSEMEILAEISIQNLQTNVIKLSFIEISPLNQTNPFWKPTQ